MRQILAMSARDIIIAWCLVSAAAAVLWIGHILYREYRLNQMKKALKIKLDQLGRRPAYLLGDGTIHFFDLNNDRDRADALIFARVETYRRDFI